MADKKTYEVGYKKPPKATRFNPGRSGNPRGRPKGLPNLRMEVLGQLRETITITEGGQKRHVTKQEAIVMRVIQMALSGEPKALQLLLSRHMREELDRAQEAQTQLDSTKEFDRMDLTKMTTTELIQLYHRTTVRDAKQKRDGG
jgi:hypothetical protein